MLIFTFVKAYICTAFFVIQFNVFHLSEAKNLIQ